MTEKSQELALAVLKDAKERGILEPSIEKELAMLVESDVRPQVTEVLERRQAPAIIRAGSDEARRLAENLNLQKQYKFTLESQKKFGLLQEGQNPPSYDQVLKTFTPEMLFNAHDFQGGRLVLVTRGKSVNELVDAFQVHGKGMNIWNTNTNSTSDIREDSFDNSGFPCRIPENWGAYIIESERNLDVQGFDDSGEKMGARLEKFLEYKNRTKVQGMDRIKYLHLAMLSLLEGFPIDTRTWTVLDEDPILSSSSIPYGRNHSYVLQVKTGRPCGGRTGARFRRSVGGDVPNF